MAKDTLKKVHNQIVSHEARGRAMADRAFKQIQKLQKKGVKRP
jgi:hypothetical protein